MHEDGAEFQGATEDLYSLLMSHELCENTCRKEEVPKDSPEAV